MKTGLIFGKFAPLTLGHMSFIRKAAAQVDKLYVFLSFDQKFVNQQPEWIRPKLALVPRLRDLKDFVVNFSLADVVINYVDETFIPGYPTGAKLYEELIRDALPEGVVLTHAFSSEREYDSYFSEHFPECEHVVIDADRTDVPISATQVRQDVFNNFHMMCQHVRERFVKKVAIVGVESTGKTTMAEELAHIFGNGSSWTPEVGRQICEEYFHSSEALMLREDYLDIAREHRNCELNAISHAPSAVVFSDTTNLITHFSAVCAGRADQSDEMFCALSNEEGDNFYDLVLYLQPDVPWVADPLRLQDTEEKRKNTNKLLDDMIKKHYSNTHVVKISGSDYRNRLETASIFVEMLIHNRVGNLKLQPQ